MEANKKQFPDLAFPEYVTAEKKSSMLPFIDPKLCNYTTL